MSNSFAQWKDKAAWGAVVFIAGAAVMGTRAIYDRPSRADVREMIKTEAPYVQDRKLLMDALAKNQKSETRMASVIEKNTDAINQLRVEIAKIKD